MEHILELLREKTQDGGVVVQDRALLERIRKMRRLDWRVNVPARLKRMTGGTGLEYRSSAIADELNLLPTLYTEEAPSLSLRGEGTEAVQGLTTRLEYFTSAALFEDCGTRASGGVPTHHRMIDAMFEGGAVTKLVKNRDIWCDYDELAAEGAEAKDAKGQARFEDDGDDVPEGRRRSKYRKYEQRADDAKKKAGVPIEWRSVDAANVVLLLEGDVIWGVIEVQKRSLSAELLKHGLGLNSDGEIVPKAAAAMDWGVKAAGETVEFIQFWDKDWMMYILRRGGGGLGIGGTAYEIEGYTREHGYGLGHPPYYCTLGGFTMNFEYGHVVTWSASETKRFEVEYLSWLRTIFGYLAIREAMTPLARTTPIDGQMQLDGDPKQPKGPEVLELASIYNLLPGQKMESILPPANADKIQVEIAQTQQDIRNQSPARKGGDLGSLGGEGFALSTVFEKDRARYNRFEAGIIEHLRMVTLDFWKLVSSLGEDVYVFRNAKEDGGYIKVSPGDFDTPVRPTWKLHVDSTAANIIKQRYAESMQKAGFWSMDQAREYMGGNPDEIEEGRSVDRMRESPDYQKGFDAEVWGRWGKGNWAKKQRLAQQIAALGMQQGAQGGLVPPGTTGAGQVGGVPDQASQAMSPNAAGAQPGQEFRPSGMPSGPSVPTQAATAQVGG